MIGTSFFAIRGQGRCFAFEDVEGIRMLALHRSSSKFEFTIQRQTHGTSCATFRVEGQRVSM